jgi:NADH-quinone oxidoreductase subunit G
MRVLPRDNEAVNECWLADRDRFSYEALMGEDRLRVPMIRRGTKWEETDWATAFEFTVAGLRKVLEEHGPESLGALASPISTLEEFYLLQKLVRALGSGNVDHRLRQTDFSDDAAAPLFPSLGRPIAELENLDGALLIGANPRKDQPLINLRLRKSALKGARVFAINPVDYDFSYRLAGKVIAGPAQMVRALAGVARALSALKKAEWPAAFAKHFRDVKPGVSEQAMAEALRQCSRASVLLGSFALSHPQAAALRSLAQYVADLCGAKLGQLPDANGAGAWLAGCVPHRGAAGKTATTGHTARGMLHEPRKSYLLLGLEPELDCLDGAAAAAAMRAAEFVVMLTTFKPSPYRTSAVEYADVWMPLAPFTETDGTFVNAEGRRQEFVTAVTPLAEARPGWKILRMLGHHLGLSGFEQDGVDDVRREMNLPDAMPAASAFPYSIAAAEETVPAAGQLMRLAEVPIYALDPIVRRAPALQKTADNPPPAARMNAAQADKLGLAAGANVQLVTPQGAASLELVVDDRVPDGCVLAPSGYPETVTIGAHGPVTVRAAS